MTKTFEPILHLEEIRKNDIIVFNYAGKQERFSIKEISDFSIKAMATDSKVLISIFPSRNLISGQWSIEKETRLKSENFVAL